MRELRFGKFYRCFIPVTRNYDSITVLDHTVLNSTRSVFNRQNCSLSLRQQYRQFSNIRGLFRKRTLRTLSSDIIKRSLSSLSCLLCATSSNSIFRDPAEMLYIMITFTLRRKYTLERLHVIFIKIKVSFSINIHFASCLKI